MLGEDEACPPEYGPRQQRVDQKGYGDFALPGHAEEHVQEHEDDAEDHCGQKLLHHAQSGDAEPQ
ncbi:hypothetical protein SDC9_171885 [bioreactor metagenome]|uniref:Uncharacterized protein n=1 Tax=bioreactor metagenome TaxID=1076179 RepID=A0A645GEA9_9ZZZZ